MGKTSWQVCYTERKCRYNKLHECALREVPGMVAVTKIIVQIEKKVLQKKQLVCRTSLISSDENVKQKRE